MKFHALFKVRQLFLVVLVPFVVALWGTAAYAQSGLLDGKQFVGEIGKKGKPAADKEDMSFKDGKMVSSACTSMGYTSFPYKATKKGDTIEFEASATHPKEGTLTWKGTISGDKLDATAFRTVDGKPDESWVKAKLQTK